MQKLTQVFEKIMKNEKVPEEWESSFTIPIFKGKGDALQCEKYRGVRLLEHGMKIWEKILEERLRRLIRIDKCQFGFMKNKSTTGAIYIMRQLQEKYGEKKRKLYHIFVDLEKAFDRVPRKAIEWALRRQGVPERLIVQVMALYHNSHSRVRATAGVSANLEIRVGVHQGSALSPLLFITVMEEATKEGRVGSPWELLYADDLVLTAETRREVEAKFERWKEKMQRRGLKVNMEKTKIMVTGKKATERVESGRWPCGCCGRGVGANSIKCTECEKWCHRRCSGLRNLRNVEEFRCPACVRRGVDVRDEEEEVGELELEEVQQFCYLGDMLDCEGGVERAVRARVSAAWQKWREIASLLVNRDIDLVERGRVYEACIRPVLLYGAETWALTRRLEEVLIRTDRRMVRYMARVTWESGLSSEEVARECGLGGLEENLRRRRLRWFGHVKRREEDDVLKQVMLLEVEGRRPRGRPRKRWKTCVEGDMRELGVREEDVEDREHWRRLIARLTP